jgi:hypothetical protein
MDNRTNGNLNGRPLEAMRYAQKYLLLPQRDNGAAISSVTSVTHKNGGFLRV